MADSNAQPVRELLRFLMSWEMLLVQGASVALVVFTPDDVLNRHAALGSFVDVVAEWLPPVAAHQRVSEFPQVTGLYFSIMFFVTPVILAYSGYMRRLVFKNSNEFDRKPMRYCISAITCFIFCMFSPPFLYIWNDARYEFFPSIPIRSSKISLGAVGWFSAGGAAWVMISHSIWIPVVVIRRMFAKYRS
jgi:hypothetical protein